MMVNFVHIEDLIHCFILDQKSARETVSLNYIQIVAWILGVEFTEFTLISS